MNFEQNSDMNENKVTLINKKKYQMQKDFIVKRELYKTILRKCTI